MSKCPRNKRIVTIVPKEDRHKYSGILLYDNAQQRTKVEIWSELRHEHFYDLDNLRQVSWLYRQVENLNRQAKTNLRIVGKHPTDEGAIDWWDFVVAGGPIMDKLHQLFKGRPKAFEIVAAKHLTHLDDGQPRIIPEWAMLVFPDDGDFGLAKLSIKWN